MPPKHHHTRIQWLFEKNISEEDRKRLAPHLSNYNRLNEILVLNGIAIEDIQKLILLELEDAQRPFILGKLVGRLKSKERDQLLTHIQSCVKAVSNRRSPVTPKVAVASATSGPVPPSGESLTESSLALREKSSSSKSKRRERGPSRSKYTR